MSSGWPARPSGVDATYASRIAGTTWVNAVSGVSTNPGPMPLTRTPDGPSSIAAHFVSISTPAFAQQ